MRVYLDVCCLNRPYDDQSQDSIRMECNAIRALMEDIERGDLYWITSPFVEFELRQNPNMGKREMEEQLLADAHKRISLNADVVARAH